MLMLPVAIAGCPSPLTARRRERRQGDRRDARLQQRAPQRAHHHTL
jgi:hypothetical protein